MPKLLYSNMTWLIELNNFNKNMVLSVGSLYLYLPIWLILFVKVLIFLCFKKLQEIKQFLPY
jgi:hypothetical protein